MSDCLVMKRPAQAEQLAWMPLPKFEEWGPTLSVQGNNGCIAMPGRNPLAVRDQDQIRIRLLQLEAESISGGDVERILKEIARLNMDCITIRDEHFIEAMSSLEHACMEVNEHTSDFLSIKAAGMCRRLKKRSEEIVALQLDENKAKEAALIVVSHVFNRSLVSVRRKGGFHCDNPALYENLAEIPGIPSKNLTSRYRDRQIMSVKRSSEPTTVALHALCQLGRQRMLKDMEGIVANDSLEEAVKRAAVLSMLVWRQLGGTVFLAAKIGFLTSWGAQERRRLETIARSVRDGMGKAILKKLEAWDEDDHAKVWDILLRYRPMLKKKDLEGKRLAANDFFSPGYYPPSFLHSAVCESHLRNMCGMQAQDDFDIMLGDVVAMADRLWDKDFLYNGKPVLDELLRIAAENISWRDACYCVMKLFNPKAVQPRFGAKELVQDLLDLDWIFPQGRTAVRDLGLYSPCGPGALKGLMKVLGREPDAANDLSPVEEVALLQCVYTHVLDLQCQMNCSESIEELHDLQYNLCEIFKVLAKTNRWPRRGIDKKIQIFKRTADTSMSGVAQKLGARRAQFAVEKAPKKFRSLSMSVEVSFESKS